MPLLLNFILDHTLAISCAFVALYFILCALYQLCFSPLCDIPGPWYAAISDFWLTTHVLRLQQCSTIDTLFKKYGPVVRVGPNKVVFNDLSTTKNVYSVLKFDKSKYYKSLLTFAFSLLFCACFCLLFTLGMIMTMRAGHPIIYTRHLRSNLVLSSMTTLPHASHAFRKRGYAPHYTPANLAQFQPDMHQSALELINVRNLNTYL